MCSNNTGQNFDSRCCSFSVSSRQPLNSLFHSFQCCFGKYRSPFWRFSLDVFASHVSLCCLLKLEMNVLITGFAAIEVGLASYSLIEAGKEGIAANNCDQKSILWLRLRVFFSLLLLVVSIISLVDNRAIYVTLFLALLLIAVDSRILFLNCPVSSSLVGSKSWPTWVGLCFVIGAALISALIVFKTKNKFTKIFQSNRASLRPNSEAIMKVSRTLEIPLRVGNDDFYEIIQDSATERFPEPQMEQLPEPQMEQDSHEQDFSDAIEDLEEVNPFLALYNNNTLAQT